MNSKLSRKSSNYLAIAMMVIVIVPSMMPIVLGLSQLGRIRALPIIDWGATLFHGTVVSVIATLVGGWIAIDVRYSSRAPWRRLTIWFLLTALFPLPLLAQCFSLLLRLTGGTGREALLIIGHTLAMCPIAFVLVFRRALLDPEEYFLVLRNFGCSPSMAIKVLGYTRYRKEVMLSAGLIFFASINESVMTGVLGGSTAYFGSVMNNLALGSADLAAFGVGMIVEILPVMAFLYVVSVRSSIRRSSF